MAESKGYIRSSDEKGSINICQNVVAVIAAAAAVDVDGVHGLYQSPGRELTTVSGKKGISRGVKVSIDGDNIALDVSFIAELGYSVSEVGAVVQKAVITAIEEAIGIKVSTVNIHICGVSLKKAKQQV
ncbi:MAG: Asp23/Gls24 family envelope stress response protein [Oscillospiraceae bacterium]|nr:Asp23/Gls24 family envelope stress response protein [Oscillospiraceae bacterium]